MAKTRRARIDDKNDYRRVTRPRLRIIVKETRGYPTGYLRAQSGERLSTTAGRVKLVATKKTSRWFMDNGHTSVMHFPGHAQKTAHCAVFALRAQAAAERRRSGHQENKTGVRHCFYMRDIRSSNRQRRAKGENGTHQQRVTAYLAEAPCDSRAQCRWHDGHNPEHDKRAGRSVRRYIQKSHCCCCYGCCHCFLKEWRYGALPTGFGEVRCPTRANRLRPRRLRYWLTLLIMGVRI